LGVAQGWYGFGPSALNRGVRAEVERLMLEVFSAFGISPSGTRQMLWDGCEFGTGHQSPWKQGNMRFGGRTHDERAGALGVSFPDRPRFFASGRKIFPGFFSPSGCGEQL
jgi:hypothetical protein